MSKTITLERAQLAKARNEMASLAAQFTKLDGTSGTLRWVHADAERRYNELVKQVQSKESRMNVTNK